MLLISEQEVLKAISTVLKCPQFALHGQCAPHDVCSLQLSSSHHWGSLKYFVSWEKRYEMAFEVEKWHRLGIVKNRLILFVNY